MAYELGIDLGTTFSAAAVWSEGRATMVDLQYGSAVVPSVVALTGEGTFLVGEPAERRALTQPDVVAREFKRRVGDPVPYLLGTETYSVERLVAELLGWMSEQVANRHGGERPDQVTVTHPANWRSYKRDVLAAAVASAGLEPVDLLPEPVAAALHHRLTSRLEPGSLSVVYDLGGGTFDAALVRSTPTGTELVGEPEGIEHLGGLDFDDALFRLVDRALDGELGQLDASDPVRWAEARRVRAECTAAKVALSSDTSASIPVILGGRSREVRATRAEFETLVTPLVEQTLDATARVLWAAGVDVSEVSAFLLVGGSSRVPLVAQRLSEKFGRPVSLEAHPKHAVALGAARHAHDRAARAAGPPPPVPLVAGPPPVPAASAGPDAPPAGPAGPAASLVTGAAAAVVDPSSPVPLDAGVAAGAGSPPPAGAPPTGDSPRVVLTAAEEAPAEQAAPRAEETSADRVAALPVAAATAAAVASAASAAAAGGGDHGDGGASGGAATGQGPGDGATDTALELDGAPRARVSSRARLVGAGALGGLALLAGILIFAMRPAGGGDGADEVRTEESTTTTVGVEVLADSVTQADAAVTEAQTSTTELQTTEQAAAALDSQLGAVSTLTVASYDAAGQKQRADLQGQAQTLATRIDAVKPLAAQAVSDSAALKLRAAAAVKAAETAKADLDKARADGDGEPTELQAAAKSAKDESATLLAEVLLLSKRVSDLTAQVAGLAQEVNTFKNAIDGIPAPTTAPPATAPPVAAAPQQAAAAPPAAAPQPAAPVATAPPATAPPATAPPVPALTVSITGPTCVVVGAVSEFDGYAPNAVSGQWGLPGFTFRDASWYPSATRQQIQPNQPGDFTWSLVVRDAYGQSASAAYSFAARFAC